MVILYVEHFINLTIGAYSKRCVFWDLLKQNTYIKLKLNKNG